MRPVSVADADAMLTYRSRADVCRYVPFEPMSRERLLERLTTDLCHTEITDEHQSLTLGVELADRAADGPADRGTVIGDVVLFFHSREHRAGELGYIFSPEVSGHGYATEACAAMLALGFDDLGLHRIVARIDGRNDSSARVAARLGMRLEAHFVRNELFKGEWSDELVYAMLADDWAARPRRS